MQQNKRRLTSEQDELRLNGLRMSARIFSCAHLSLHLEEEASGNRALGAHAHPRRRSIEKDGAYVG